MTHLFLLILSSEGTLGPYALHHFPWCEIGFCLSCLHLWSVVYLHELADALLVLPVFCCIIRHSLSPTLHYDLSTFIITKAPNIVLCSFVYKIQMFICLCNWIVFMCVKRCRKRISRDHQFLFIHKKQVETSRKVKVW